VNLFKRALLQAAWAACATTQRATKRGKKPVAPEIELDAIGFLQFGMDEILKKHNAPESWEQQIGFFVACIIIPSRVNGASLADGIITIKHDYKKGRHDDAIIHAANFGRLYAESPAVFLRVMLDIGAEIEKKLCSPETVVAFVHLINPKCYKIKATDFAKRISSAELPVSSKVVEHARQKLREYEQRLSPAK
jgi:hypothetical protein